MKKLYVLYQPFDLNSRCFVINEEETILKDYLVPSETIDFSTRLSEIALFENVSEINIKCQDDFYKAFQLKFNQLKNENYSLNDITFNRI